MANHCSTYPLLDNVQNIRNSTSYIDIYIYMLKRLDFIMIDRIVVERVL